MDGIELVHGDVNGDGLTDTVDAAATLKEYALVSAQKPETFTDKQKMIANINHDQFVDTVDATVTMMYYAKLSAGNSMDVFEFIDTLDK